MKVKRRFRKKRFIRRKVCEFCSFSIDYLSFRNVSIVSKLTNFQGRILPSKILGTCAKHQRMVAQSIKQARFMAIIPYTKPRIRLQKRFFENREGSQDSQTDKTFRPKTASETSQTVAVAAS